MLTDEDVQEILRLLDELPYEELRLTTRHFTLSLRRAGGPDGGWVQATEPLSEPRLLSAAPAPEAPEAPAAPHREGLAAVCAPLLGTFYRAPMPGAPPFVEVGTAVEADTVVGILETMKLMNSVYAGTPGRIAEICLADAQFAPEGTVLMLVEPE